ncbi:MAG: flippase-like domain-containing protein [Ignavibacteria bacterium]|nr:flippase-like domain-containing protein [Ignavibacteria bacterium]NNL20601.1 flippase-like domain-containing protein [Ignavibacteriaceae bacterium]
MINKLKKKILLSIIIGGVLYLAFTVYADFNQVLKAFALFNWLLLPPLLVLSFLNYLFRFFKWDYYLSIIKVKMKKRDSLSVFMSGLVMSVTPGKFGEILKSLLVKEITNVSISKTAPIVLAERLTDFLSLLILALIGAFIYDIGGELTIGISVFFILLIVLISNKNLSIRLLSQLEKIKYFKKYLSNIHSAYESSYLLLKPVSLVSMTLVSLIAWGFECVGYYLILLNFNIDFGLVWASFNYSFSTIVGAISMLPGGLGITEGSLTFLLIQKNVSKDIAVTTTFIVRVVTLWFAVLVGIISVLFYQKRYGKISVDSNESSE